MLDDDLCMYCLGMSNVTNHFYDWTLCNTTIRFNYIVSIVVLFVRFRKFTAKFKWTSHSTIYGSSRAHLFSLPNFARVLFLSLLPLFFIG